MSNLASSWHVRVRYSSLTGAGGDDVVDDIIDALGLDFAVAELDGSVSTAVFVDDVESCIAAIGAADQRVGGWLGGTWILIEVMAITEAKFLVDDPAATPQKP